MSDVGTIFDGMGNVVCHYDIPDELETFDPVEKPEHYASGKVECIDWIAECLSEEELRGYLRGNVLKYTWRYQHKGHPVQDLRKAIWYARRLAKTFAEE